MGDSRVDHRVCAFLKITQTYGEFWKDAFDAWYWVAALFVVNWIIGGLAIYFVIEAVNPADAFRTALVVAIGLFAYFATPIATKTFVGADLAGQPESVKLSDLYTPWDKLVSGEIDKPVRARKSGSPLDLWVKSTARRGLVLRPAVGRWPT